MEMTDTLASLNKDALVEIHRTLFGNVGDYARTPKQSYIDRILSAEPEKVADAIAAQHGKVPAPKAAAVSGDAATQLAALIQSLAGNSVNEDRVREIVNTALAEREPSRIIITPQSEVKIDAHTHPVFPKVLKLVAAGLNVLLVGPAGCGKTKLGEQVAEALAREFGTLHCTAGASESQLLGWLLPVAEGGRFEYVPSQFARLYEQGNSVFLLDEIDAADPNMLLVINGALANGHLHIPQRHKAPAITRGKDVAIIGAANTFGTGADMVYAGRNQLDGATLDRWYVVEMDYDAQLERQVIGDDREDKQLGEWILGVREKSRAAKLRRVVSTRMIQKAVAARRAGVDVAEIKHDLLAGWTRDELAKVGV
jgi:cobaltochelatase CobS